MWLGMNSFKMVETPAEVDAMTKEIVDIQIPAEFTGKVGFKFEMFGVGMKMVAYEGNTANSALLIMESKQPGGASAEEQFDQFQIQMEQQGQGEEFDLEDLSESETETKTLTVLGNPVDFKFTKGKSQKDGQELRQVSGVISKDGAALIIMVQMPEESYNEEEIVTMIESIK